MLHNLAKAAGKRGTTAVAGTVSPATPASHSFPSPAAPAASARPGCRLLPPVAPQHGAVQLRVPLDVQPHPREVVAALLHAHGLKLPAPARRSGWRVLSCAACEAAERRRHGKSRLRRAGQRTRLMLSRAASLASQMFRTAQMAHSRRNESPANQGRFRGSTQNEPRPESLSSCSTHDLRARIED